MNRHMKYRCKRVSLAWPALLMTITFVACSTKLEEPTTSNESARLDRSRLERFTSDAIAGSLEAAHLLALHYEYGRPDPLQVEKWLGYELRNGNRDARVSLGALLAQRHNFYPVTKESCARGVKYLEEAKKDGSLAAAEMLNNLSPICTKPWLNPYSR